MEPKCETCIYHRDDNYLNEGDGCAHLSLPGFLPRPLPSPRLGPPRWCPLNGYNFSQRHPWIVLALLSVAATVAYHYGF